MKLFFAGAESKVYMNTLRDNGVTRTLESAYYLNFKKTPNELAFKDYLLDSGGFSFRKFNKSVAVTTYIDYINAHNIKICFNLDTADVRETLKNQTLLNRHTNAYVIPVYHYSDYIDPKHRGLLEEFAGRFPYVAAAGVNATSRPERDNFYAYVFKTVRDKVLIHGLAATSPVLMEKFPFYSVDSTTWLNPERYGASLEFKKGTVHNVQSLRVVREKSRALHNRQFIEPKDRLKSSIKTFLDAEEYFTKLWSARGITFKEFKHGTDD